MNSLQIALLGLGIIPAVVFLTVVIIHIRRWPPSSRGTGAASTGRGFEARPTNIGGSNIARTSRGGTPAGGRTSEVPADVLTPRFATLRVDCESVGNARWLIRIRFLLMNRSSQMMVLDDIHAKVYRRLVPTPPYLTISYRGEIRLLRDNSIDRGKGVYSLEPGDGFEITLVLELARLEGAPLYGSDHETSGSLLVVFGLLIDYYAPASDPLERRAIPSDGLYLMECVQRDKPARLIAIRKENLAEQTAPRFRTNAANLILADLPDLLAEHAALHLVPRV